MLSFDYIIAGGGSAGCALANRLSECGRYTVALLEAGGSHKNPLITIPFGILATVPKGLANWSFETVPQKGLNGRIGYQPRGKALGGSSSINAMIYIRGVKEDYDNWAAMGNTGWSYDEVLPYFKKAQNRKKGANDYHGVGGPLSVSPAAYPNPINDIFIKAGGECQIPYTDDFNGASQEGIGYYEVTQDNGRRCSAAHAYLEPALDRANLTVIKRAFVHRVTFADKKATGVEVKIRGKKQQIRANKEVILSSGAFQSPQLLLLSGVGPKEQLQRHGIAQVAELPGVGENLHDHIDYTLMYRSNSKHAFGFNPSTMIGMISEQIKFLTGKPSVFSTNFTETGAFYYADPSEPSPDTQLHFTFAMIDNHGIKKHIHAGYSCHVCLLRPKSRGRLTLRNADAETPPVIDPAFLTDERDLSNFILGIRRAQQIMRAPAFDEIRGPALYESDTDDEETLIQDIKNRADTIYHPVGTCKMGPDNDPLAVVDASLRVKGVKALRVIDASIMPAIISGNTNAPSIMIGEKGADMILQDARAA